MADASRNNDGDASAAASSYEDKIERYANVGTYSY